MKIERIECWIEVDDEALDEYGTETSDDGKKCSTWIPSEEGQIFSIFWRDPKRTRCTSGDVDIDGVELGTVVLEPRPIRINDVACYDCVYISPTQGRDLRFGALKLTDDDACTERDQQRVGEVSVTIWRSRVIGRNPYGGVSIDQPQMVHEKTKKGLAHTVIFGEVEELEEAAYGVDTEAIDDEPFATFTFRYRSLDLLRANGIAALPTAATPEAHASSASASGTPSRKRRASTELTPKLEDVDVKDEVIDFEGIEEAEERVRRIEDELRQARFDMHRRRGNKRIKLEDVLPIVPGEVIDLTED
ncbi:hypothetical protein BD626DRAFT_492184 [Schizophyllum amplum]|uniref:DUF7918 domain-containing protein n=1 Tax=Schizophyllum amplum TaxID=97359 RepID=A0A550CID0_9AGAR|nr:hypothetical protein BD626DRAFT_492184 [Auriculariopsis ampla]